MSLRSLESAITAEAREVLNNRILEWSTGPVAAEDGEVVVHCARHAVNICVKTEHDKRAK